MGICAHRGTPRAHTHETGPKPGPLFMENDMPTTEPATSAEKARLVEEHMAHTQGAHEYFPTIFGGLRFTTGIMYVAETCGAYWLIDAIASHQTTAAVRAEPFQLWQLKLRTGAAPGWELACWTDTPGSEYARRVAFQAIGFSTFLEEFSPLKLYVEGGVLYLPAER
jgi:hypothetical protein